LSKIKRPILLPLFAFAKIDSWMLEGLPPSFSPLKLQLIFFYILCYFLFAPESDQTKGKTVWQTKAVRLQCKITYSVGVADPPAHISVGNRALRLKFLSLQNQI